MDGIEELTLKVSDLILFIWFPCFKDLLVIEYTYVACFKVALCFVFALCGLIVFMVYWATTYSEPFQTSVIEFFMKLVTSNEITSLLKRWKGFWYASAECKVKCSAMFCYIYIAVYFMFEITCMFCHFSTIRFPFETLGI